MNKIKINLGRGLSILKKSNRLIGIKVKPKAKTLPKELTKRRLKHEWLGGFRIYSVGRSLRAVEKVLNKVRKHPNVVLGTHVYFTPNSNKPVVPNGMILITFNNDTSKAKKVKLIKSLGLKRYKEVSDQLIVVSTTKNSSNPLKCILQLKESDIVAEAIPDFDVPIDEYDVAPPADDLFPVQWYLQNKGAAPGEPRGKIIKGADLKVVKAWNRLGNKGANTVRVAIFDRGFQMDHPAYADRIAGTFEIYEDLRTGHGTSCASLAVASETGEGMVGVAPNAELIIIKGPTFSWYELDQVFKFCMENEVDIISCSWGEQEFTFGRDPMHDHVFQEVTTKGRNGKGCIVLFAAGNDNSEHVNIMATFPNVICVGGTTSADEHWWLSNRGEEMSISAPAGNWPLLVARAPWEDVYWEDKKERGTPGLYSHFEGTSGSTPLVAGVCALMLSANPDLTAAEVRNILETTADKVGSANEYTNGHSIRFGYGRVNADRAVAESLRLKDPTRVLPDMNTGSGSGLYHFMVDPLPSKGWGVQTGALREYGNVLKMVDQLQKMFGKRVIININELNGEPNYKTILGPFNTRNEAKAFQQQVTAAGIDSFLTNLKNLK